MGTAVRTQPPADSVSGEQGCDDDGEFGQAVQEVPVIGKEENHPEPEDDRAQGGEDQSAPGPVRLGPVVACAQQSGLVGADHPLQAPALNLFL